MKCLVLRDFTDDKGDEHKQNEILEMPFSESKVYLDSSLIIPDRTLELENQTVRVEENMMIKRRFKGRVAKTSININR